jgi:hypothetical protein
MFEDHGQPASFMIKIAIVPSSCDDPKIVAGPLLELGLKQVHVSSATAEVNEYHLSK